MRRRTRIIRWTDDGNYYTWTLDEAAEALTAEEQALVVGYYNIGRSATCSTMSAKNVLHVKRGLDVVARQAGVRVVEALARLESAKAEDACGAAEASCAVCGQDDVCCVECDVHLCVPGGGARAG